MTKPSITGETALNMVIEDLFTLLGPTHGISRYNLRRCKKTPLGDASLTMWLKGTFAHGLYPGQLVPYNRYYGEQGTMRRWPRGFGKTTLADIQAGIRTLLHDKGVTVDERQLPLDWRDWWAERASILEYDAGYTRVTAERAALDQLRAYLLYRRDHGKALVPEEDVRQLVDTVRAHHTEVTHENLFT